jgi:hypothetical protein
MVGLVLDAGLLLAARRQAQNAADAAAMAAAFDQFKGFSTSTALATANSFLANNGLSGVTLTLNAGASNALNIPPQDPGNTGSPYKGQANYVEVVLTKPVHTLFIQLLGVNSSQQVTARAVAGFEPVGAGEGVFVLDPTAAPGLDVTSNQGSGAFVRLLVHGDITVNSYGGGQDQFGNAVAPNTNYVSGNADAVKTQSGLSVPAIVATQINVAGGVTDITSIDAYDPAYAPNYYNSTNPTHPVLANLQTTAPDPLASLPTPTTSNGLVNATAGSYPQAPGGTTGTLTASASTPQKISVGNSNNYTFIPGVYQSITITGGTATFQPGIYVVGVNITSSGGLTINSGTVTGSGVMFYITGSNFVPTSGLPDSSDGNSTPGSSSGVKFASLGIGAGANINLSSYNNAGNANDPFNGMLFYQRRWDTSTASIGGNSSNTTLSGTLYAKWANMQIAGSGNLNAQFLVGSMSITGGSTVSINATGKLLGRANVVFLVE